MNVVGSGAVGPEAIESILSPTTSLIIRAMVFLAGMYLSSCPPLTRDRCFLTVFNSIILAPLFIRREAVAPTSLILTPSAGTSKRAEPPPDIRRMTRASSGIPRRKPSSFKLELTVSSPGTGCSPSRTVTLGSPAVLLPFGTMIIPFSTLSPRDLNAP